MGIKDFVPNSWKDWRDLANLIINNWDQHYGRATLHRNTLTLITGGWSENEEVQIEVEQNKYMRWAWHMSKCGGLSVYKLPTKKSFVNKV